MCLVLVLIKCHPKVPVVVLHNRDEFTERPTTEPAEHGPLICGIDGLAQGTWCGINKESGRAVFLTNVRLVDPPGAKVSRGTLVMDLLQGRAPQEPRSLYGLHNVVHLNVYAEDDLLMHAVCESNDPANPRFACVPLSAGQVHVLSNSHLDDLSWPKLRWLRSAAAAALARLAKQEEQDPMVFLQTFADLMSNCESHPFDEQDDIPSDERERYLRQTCLVQLPGYGTRTQTALLKSDDGSVLYMSRSIDSATSRPSPWKSWTVQAKL